MSHCTTISRRFRLWNTSHSAVHGPPRFDTQWACIIPQECAFYFLHNMHYVRAPQHCSLWDVSASILCDFGNCPILKLRDTRLLNWIYSFCIVLDLFSYRCLSVDVAIYFVFFGSVVSELLWWYYIYANSCELWSFSVTIFLFHVWIKLLIITQTCWTCFVFFFPSAHK